jgi:carbohydrate-binding DOMON domain-containing protein
VTVCAVLTEEAVAEKLALVAPAATVTEAGTVTEVLSLTRLTVKLALGAAVFSVTVQASVLDPVMEELEQASPVSTGTPVPLRAMAAVPLVEELLAMVSVPLAAPAAVGSN